MCRWPSLHGKAQVLGNLGLLYADQGAWDLAIAQYEEAIELDQRVGDAHGMALTLSNLGDARLACNEPDAAAQCFAQAYQILAALQAPEAERTARVLVELLGSPEAAAAYVAQVVAGEPQPGDEGIDLEELLDSVISARRGDQDLGERLFDLTRALAADPTQPPELRALAQILHRVLAGARNPDLSELPPDLAGAVRAMLARL